MRSIIISFVIWMFTVLRSLHCDQSLSFSIPKNASVLSTPSFWNGKLPSKLLEESLEIEIYINKPRGLLFYAIDNLYQTLWAEFIKNDIVFSYFNFESKTIDEYKHDLHKLCGLSTAEDFQINLSLSLLQNKLYINCNSNNKEELIFYSPSITSISNSTLATFKKEMSKPIPIFESINSTSDTITYLWIGNTPYSNAGEYQNVVLLSQFDNLLGCIKSFKSGHTMIHLATAGSRHGNMIEAQCKPVCSSNPCYNEGKCLERWRQQFYCECGLSRFVGTFCNESYGVEFKDDIGVNVTEQYKLENFQISFRHLRTFNQVEATKVFSIAFMFNKSLYVYIDNRGYLQIKFTTQNSPNLEEKFRNEIEHNRTYTMFISAGTTGINVKLADTYYHYIIDEKNLARSASSLVISTIFVADSHSLTMKWMKRFNGCISNLILSSGKRTFLWNQIQNFDKLPTCNKKVPKVSTSTPEVKYATLDDIPLQSVISEKNLVSTANITYAIVGASILLIIIISSIIIYKFKRVNNQSYTNKNKKLNNQYEKALSFNTYQNQSVPNSPPILYKPPYKARSISYSSNIGKSVTSLPISVTPTLVTPEDVQRLNANTDEVISEIMTPKIKWKLSRRVNH